MEQHTVCLLNDSFPPTIDGVANTVINYAKIIEENYGHAIVATPSVPGAHDTGFSFPVLRYPSIDARRMWSCCMHTARCRRVCWRARFAMW